MESFAKLKVSFSCYKKATSGSFFYSIEKQLERSKLEMDSWRLLHEKVCRIQYLVFGFKKNFMLMK